MNIEDCNSAGPPVATDLMRGNGARERAAEVMRRAHIAHPDENDKERAARFETAFDALVNHLENAAEQSSVVDAAMVARTRWIQCIRTNAPTKLEILFDE